MANHFKQPLARSAGNAFCSLFGGKTDQLNESELLAFYQLKEYLNRQGDPQVIRNLFRGLYQLYFYQACPLDTVSKRWILLGFQGERPETDLRAGGLMALDLILRFVQMQRPTVDSMAQPQNDFFFALSSINVAYWLKVYFHLSDQQQGTWKKCGRTTLKKFGRMLASNPVAFAQLHRLCLLYLYTKIWMRMKFEGKHINLSHFNDAFKQLVERFQCTMKNTINNWDTFEIYWLYGA